MDQAQFTFLCFLLVAIFIVLLNINKNIKEKR